MDRRSTGGVGQAQCIASRNPQPQLLRLLKHSAKFAFVLPGFQVFGAFRIH